MELALLGGLIDARAYPLYIWLCCRPLVFDSGSELSLMVGHLKREQSN